jgi:F-box and leucine-rich repeat protein GRR1
LTLKSIMTLLNSCPRLTHLSLTGVAAFQRDDFQPYCRTAPTDFTQHQRDVFCVFSGPQVSKFRDFLNTSPQFANLRDSMPVLPGRRRAHRAPMAAALAHIGDVEGFDDEMGEEDNDFEGLDASDMVMDPNALAPLDTNAQHETTLPPLAEAIPHIPSAPLVHQEPFGNGSLNEMDFINTTPDITSPQAFSSFITNEPAVGAPPLSAIGQASMATLASRPGPSQPRAVETPPSGGASTATMHQIDQGVEGEQYP